MMARLPNVGSDIGTWGDLLAQYLLANHDADGTHQTSFAIFNVKDFGALGNDSGDDGPAINLAIVAASVKGGIVFFPPGTYRILTALTPPIGKAIAYIGCGPGLVSGSGNAVISELHFPTDLGSGVYAIDAINGWHTTKIEGLKIRGVNETQTLGNQGMNMDGIRFGPGQTIRDTVISGGFRAGLVEAGDHAYLENVRSGGGNYYGLLYPSSGVITHGDNRFVGCNFSGCAYASIAVSSGNSLAGDDFYGTHMGFSPYGIYKIAGASSAEDFISNSLFSRSSIESCGNAGIYDASGFGRISSSRWDKCGVTIDATYRIAAEGLRRGWMDVYQMNGVYWNLGDQAVLPQYAPGTAAHLYLASGGAGNEIHIANWTAGGQPLFAGPITPQSNFFIDDATGFRCRMYSVASSVASQDVCEIVRIANNSIGVRPAVSASGKPLAGVALVAASSGYVPVIEEGGRALSFNTGPTADSAYTAGDRLTPDGVSVAGRVKTVASATDRVVGVALYDSASGKAIIIRLDAK